MGYISKKVAAYGQFVLVNWIRPQFETLKKRVLQIIGVW